MTIHPTMRYHPVLTLLCCLMPACIATPQDRVVRYIEALNRHEIDEALTYLSDDFRLVFGDTGLAMTKEQLRSALSWDVGANGRMAYRFQPAGPDSVVVSVTEQNDVLRLLGIDGIRSRNVFVVNAEGFIEEQRTQPMPNQPSIQEKLEPAIAWARSHRPDALRAVYPEGRMIYTKSTAEGWIELLRDWQEETAER